MDLKRFDISESHGFLREISDRLPEKYAAWEEIVTNIPKLIKEDKLTRTIELLHVLPTITLHDQFIHRGYAILSFITSGYVWQKSDPNTTLPKQIAVPLVELAGRIGIVPICTYSSMILYNWKLIDPRGSFSLDNLTTRFRFTDYPDEEWFNKIHIMMEYIGSTGLSEGIKLINNPTVNGLHNLKLVIETIIIVVSRMKEHCLPEVFWYYFRPYLCGWKDNNQIPNGLLYETLGNREYRGGSAAESSLIQFFDKLLGVEHKDEETKTFLDEMLLYMPSNHTEFLKNVKDNSIRDKVQSDATLVEAYNEVIDVLTKLRKVHYGIVYTYVLSMMPRASRDNAVGSGGSTLTTLLQKSITETTKTKLSGWG